MYNTIHIDYYIHLYTYNFIHIYLNVYLLNTLFTYIFIHTISMYIFIHTLFYLYLSTYTFVHTILYIHRYTQIFEHTSFYVHLSNFFISLYYTKNFTTISCAEGISPIFFWLFFPFAGFYLQICQFLSYFVQQNNHFAYYCTKLYFSFIQTFILSHFEKEGKSRSLNCVPPPLPPSIKPLAQ